MKKFLIFTALLLCINLLPLSTGASAAVLNGGVTPPGDNGGSGCEAITANAGAGIFGCVVMVLMALALWAMEKSRK